MERIKAPEDVFVALMDYLDDVEFYTHNPKAFKGSMGITLKERTQQMRVLFANIPREDWLKVHGMFMFAPDMLSSLQDIVKAHNEGGNVGLPVLKASGLLEQMAGWTEPPLE